MEETLGCDSRCDVLALDPSYPGKTAFIRAWLSLLLSLGYARVVVGGFERSLSWKNRVEVIIRFRDELSQIKQNELDTSSILLVVFSLTGKYLPNEPLAIISRRSNK